MSTKHRGTARERRTLDAYIALMRASESVTSRTAPLLEGAGLTPGQFGALEALLHLGPMRQGEIAAKLLRSGGNLTLVVDNLQRRGLVRRRRARPDRRVVTVQLTPAGRRTARRAFRRVLGSLVGQMGVLTAGEQGQLRRLCRAVGKGVRPR